MLLPQIEQQNLYSSITPGNPIRFRQALADPIRVALLQKSLPSFLCPSDPISALNADRLIDQSSLRVPIATSSYVGNQGSGTRSPSDGVLLVDSNISFRSLTDGLSNMILAGERSANDIKKTGKGGASVWGGTTISLSVNCNATLPSECSVTLYSSSRVQINTGKVYFGGTGNALSLAFSSSHTGVVQFLLCDGSVRTTSENIDSAIQDPNDPQRWGTFQKLTSRADGQVIGEY